MNPKMMNRRQFLKAVAMTAAGISLAACTPKATPAPTEVPVKPADTMPAPTAAAGKKVIAFTKAGLDDGLKACLDLVQQKAGVAVEIQTSPEESFRGKVTADFAAGGGAYDVIYMPYNDMREFQTLGHLVNLDEYISASTTINAGDFIPALLKAYGGWGGGQYALPGKADVYINCFRKDLIEDPKIQSAFKSKTGAELKAPKTVAEAKVIAEYFTKKLNPDSPIDYGWTNWSEKAGDHWWWGARLSALGGGWLDDKFHPNFNNDAGLTSLKDYLEMHKYAAPEIATYEWGKAAQSFLSGSSFSMDVWNGFGGEPNQAESGDGKSVVVGKTGFDVLSGYEVGGALKQASVLGGWCLSVTKYTKDIQAAFDSIVVLSSQEAELLRVPLGYSPCRTSTYAKITPDPITEHYTADSGNFAVATIGADIYAPPIGAQLQDFMGTTLSETIQGQHTPEEALKLMDDRWTKLLKDANIYG